MTSEALEKELKEGKLNYLYLLYGEEKYLLDMAVKKIKKIFGEIVLRNKLYRNRRRKYTESNARNTDALLWIF